MKRAPPDHFTNNQFYYSIDPASLEHFNSEHVYDPKQLKTRKPSHRKPRKRNRHSMVQAPATYQEFVIDTPPSNNIYITERAPPNTKRRRTMNQHFLDIYEGPLYEVDLKRLEISTNLQRLRRINGYDEHEEALVWTDSEGEDDYYQEEAFNQ